MQPAGNEPDNSTPLIGLLAAIGNEELHGSIADADWPGPTNEVNGTLLGSPQINPERDRCRIGKNRVVGAAIDQSVKSRETADAVRRIAITGR